MLRYIESITTENTSAWRKQLSKLLVQKLIANVYDYYPPKNARKTAVVLCLCYVVITISYKVRFFLRCQ